MAGGLAALLDDVAVLARMAAANLDDVAAASAKAGSRAVGVVIDDAAVTPQYVQDIEPRRELPIIWRITKGSIVNKIIIILPVLLLLSVFAPVLLTPLLMLGGLYLSFEGAEKLWQLVRGTDKTSEPATARGPEAEDRVVKGAVRTDLILSAEIMVISMNAVDTDSVWMRAAVLVVVALAITALVYGAVALLVKMDDIGLAMAQDADSPSKARFGRRLVTAMPKVMTVISYVGMIAMLWVGGHILLVGTHDLGLAQPYGFVHGLENAVVGVVGIGGVLAWLVNTFFSFVLGLIIGAITILVVHLLPWGRHGTQTDPDAATADDHEVTAGPSPRPGARPDGTAR